MLRMPRIQPPSDATTSVNAGSAAWLTTSPKNSHDQFGTGPCSYAWEAGNQCSVVENTAMR